MKIYLKDVCLGIMRRGGSSNLLYMNIYSVCLSGPTDYVLQQRDLWVQRMMVVCNVDPIELPKKVFKPKFALPQLSDYSVPAPSWFWKLFPKNYTCPAVSLINGDKLRELALMCNYPDLGKLDALVHRIKFGSKIGCEGKYREASWARNSKSAFEDGFQVTDEIASWIQQGFAYGPVNLEDMPRGAKVSSIMTRGKPNGAVRIILNLSAPIGFSVNDGIDSDKFPTTMSSTLEWLRVLNRVGRGAWMTKIDWSSAYKHFPVAEEDTDLQYFTWLGKAFKELCLIFGSASSPGLFDEGAKLVVVVVIILAAFNKDWMVQHLDDAAAAAPAHRKDVLIRFDETFAWVANQVGIQLAPRDDKEKSFGPSQQGVVLGVWYDTQNWVWGIPAEKLHRLRILLKEALESKEIRQDRLWTIVGKIIHIKPLVPSGCFNIDYLLRANSQSEDPGHLVELSPLIKGQMWFWYQALPLCSGMVSIPNPDRPIAPWAVDIYTDASGGTLSSPWHGVGVVTAGWWAFAPWGKAINGGKITSKGRRLDRVMSALELLGPLLALAAGFRQFAGKEVNIWVDNAASVIIWQKGYSSRCDLSSTVVKAIHAVSTSIGCRVHVSKITRCSLPMATMADALSKGAFLRFWALVAQEGLDMPLEMAWVPQALVEWILAPADDPCLGDKLVSELALYGPVLKIS